MIIQRLYAYTKTYKCIHITNVMIFCNQAGKNLLSLHLYTCLHFNLPLHTQDLAKNCHALQTCRYRFSFAND